MSLAPREQWKLSAIETELRANDPRLEAMFRVFAKRYPRSRGQLRRMSLSLWVARRGLGRVIILLVTIVMLLIACAVAAAVLA